jgi:hypothetical protein
MHEHALMRDRETRAMTNCRYRIRALGAIEMTRAHERFFSHRRG